MENEGVIAASFDFPNGGEIKSNNIRSGARSYGSASSSDLEYMINDILTVED